MRKMDGWQQVLQEIGCPAFIAARRTIGFVGRSGLKGGTLIPLLAL